MQLPEWRAWWSHCPIGDTSLLASVEFLWRWPASFISFCWCEHMCSCEAVLPVFSSYRHSPLSHAGVLSGPCDLFVGLCAPSWHGLGCPAQAFTWGNQQNQLQSSLGIFELAQSVLRSPLMSRHVTRCQANVLRLLKVNYSIVFSIYINIINGL